MAVSADGEAWFLLNVSADVRGQINSMSELAPPPAKPRGTAIAGCVLTDAEIDHTSGLLQLREGCRIPIYSTDTVHRWLRDYLTIEPILEQFADRPWHELELEKAVDLPLADGQWSGLRIRVLGMEPDVPRFVPESDDRTIGSVVALQIEDLQSGGRLLYAPCVAAIGERLDRAARRSDGILLDGTFWSDDELLALNISDRTARQMGHLPIDGFGGTLEWFARIPVRHRAYVHINNTNPILNDQSRQRRVLEEHSIHVTRDGDSWEL